jgi:hypothetical protein
MAPNCWTLSASVFSALDDPILHLELRSRQEDLAHAGSSRVLPALPRTLTTDVQHMCRGETEQA